MLRGLDAAATVGGNHRGKKLLDRRETASMMPLYLWVRDRAEAVFAIALLEKGIHKELAFVTIDRELIEALEATFERYAAQRDACTDDLAPVWPLG